MGKIKLLLTGLCLVLCCFFDVRPQSPGIRPEPPEGKGVIALRAARLIDGTGAPTVLNAIVIVANNKISVVGDAKTVRSLPV